MLALWLAFWAIFYALTGTSAFFGSIARWAESRAIRRRMEYAKRWNALHPDNPIIVDIRGHSMGERGPTGD